MPGPLRALARTPGRRSTDDYVKPSKRVFDNAKVSTTSRSSRRCRRRSSLSRPSSKLYDLVVKRFLAVFFPPAEFLVTTRITTVGGHSFQTEGKVLVKPGLAGDLRQGGAGRDDAEPGAGAARRDGAHRERRRARR